MSGRDFSSYLGPGDKDLPRSEVEGYQPVSRIGEVVMNAFGANAAKIKRRTAAATSEQARVPVLPQSILTSSPRCPTL